MNSPAHLEHARFNMIEQQIRPWNVSDPEILALLGALRREDFVPPAHRALAFVDMELPLPGGEYMLSPRLEARLLQDLQIKPSDRVLEIGAGSGFMAALLARRAAQVLSLELLPELVEMARANLRDAGIANAEVRKGDGAQDLSGLGQFDVILLSGSVASVPQSLLKLLKPEGRLATITGEEPIMRATLVVRTGEGQFQSKQPWDANAPRLHHFDEPSGFHF